MASEMFESGDKATREIDFMLDSFERRSTILSPPDTGKPAVKAVKAAKVVNALQTSDSEAPYSYVYSDVVWRNVILFIILHVLAIQGIYVTVTGQVTTKTCLSAYIYGMIGAFGITAGSHRLWSHSAYKAKWPLRCMLMIAQTMAFQNSVWEWARDHRVHHKFTDTNADPHNYSRGFFFAHMGWLMVRKHPLVKEKGAGVDMSDIESDPICMFQKKYYLILMPLLAFILPTIIFHATEGDLWTAILATNLRYFISLHCSWLVNSAAHFWGDKPFDKDIKPTDNRRIAFVTVGEGWHNYHHVFPWDYKAAELGGFMFNPTTSLIDFFAWVGWAYDLKVVSDPMVCKRALRTGDGSYNANKHNENSLQTSTENIDLVNMDHENMLWGWNDKELPENAKKYVEIRNKLH